MPDNLPDVTMGFALPGFGVVDLEGRDARDFAQAQFMNDVCRLADATWQWNGWLTPKGRTVVLFLLLRLTADHVRLVVVDAEPDDVAARLRPFVFRRKVTITVPPVAIRGSFAAPDGISGNAIGERDGAFVLDVGLDGCERTLHVGAATDRVTDAPDEVARWRACDLEGGLPRLDTTGVERWTPQQLSLERLSAFSVSKGCYPGQEIVARTHFLGRAKRGLALFDCATTPAIGATIEAEGEAWGEIVSTACTSAGCSVLAVGGLDVPAETALADGHPLQRRPLRAGLAR